MQTDVRKCSNCGGQMVFQNKQWVCMSCGSAFAVDWESEDVERIRQATAQDRANAQVERMQTLNATRQQIQMAEQRNQQMRDAQHRGWRIFKPIILAMVIFFIIGFINIVSNVALSGLFLKGCVGQKSNSVISSLTGSKITFLTDLSKAIQEDADMQKKLLSSGMYHAKYDSKKEIELSDPEEIATRSGEPELVESYLQDASFGKRIILVYKNTYRTPSGDRTKEVYSAYSIMFSDTLDENGHAKSSFAAGITSDEKYDWKIRGYESIEELRKDNQLKLSGNSPILMEIKLSADGEKTEKSKG